MESQPNPRRSDHNLVWGGLLIVLGGLFLLNQFLPWNFGALIPITILGGIGLTFVSVYLSNREHWWALIPAYVMFAVSGIILLSDVFHVNGDFIGAYVMFAIAFPFLYVFLRNREHWWALIPAGVMGSIGVALTMGAVLHSMLPVIPVIMIVGGIYLLVRNLGRSNGPAAAPANREFTEFTPITAKTGPEADKPKEPTR